MHKNFYRLLVAGMLALGICPAFALAQDDLAAGADAAQASESALVAASATVEIPQAATGMVYTGLEQVGVAPTDRYVVEGGSATESGTYVATVSLIDPANYTWADGTSDSKQITWSISSAWVAGSTIVVDDAVYTGEALYPSISVSLGETGLVENVDYIAVFSNNVAVGRGCVAIKGIGNYSGVDKASFGIAPANIENAQVDLYASDYLSAGLVKKPAVLSVLLDGVELRPGKDYRIEYFSADGKKVSSCVEPGAYFVRIIAQGNYVGTIEEPFAV